MKYIPQLAALFFMIYAVLLNGFATAERSVHSLDLQINVCD